LKKFLFSTTALAVAGTLAFGVDANAAAKPIKIGVGGFMTTEWGYGDNSGEFEAGSPPTTGTSNKRASLNNVQDSEIYFTGSSKLDSGVTVSITIQLESDQAVGGAGTQIDESYMKLTGAFGDLRLGSTTGTNSVLKHTAPYVGVAPDGGGSDAYISVPAAVTASNSTNTSSSGDANKIGYISPRTGGLAVGMSYTPSVTNANTAPVNGGNDADGGEVLEAAISFETTVGTSSVGLDVAAETRSNSTHAYRAGAKVGFGGITIGGSVFKRNDNDGDNTATATDNNANSYDLGVSYAMGAYTFGVAKAYGERSDGDGTQDTESKWSAGMSYAIDTGVTGTLTYIKADYDDGAAGAATDDNDGHAVIGQIKVSF
jgi:hypothetical protein